MATCLQACSSLRPQRILVYRYNCESLLYSGKWHCYDNGEGLQSIRQCLKNKFAFKKKITKREM